MKPSDLNESLALRDAQTRRETAASIAASIERGVATAAGETPVDPALARAMLDIADSIRRSYA